LEIDFYMSAFTIERGREPRHVDIELHLPGTQEMNEAHEGWLSSLRGVTRN